MNQPRRTIEGRCHCGNIAFTVALPQPEGPIPVRACSCSFCRKHGGLYTSHPEGSVKVQIANASEVQRYRFGTQTADFLLCRTCGVVPVVISDIDGILHAVVSVHAFEAVDASEFSESVADFDGETTGSRLERRQRSWIPDVQIDWG